MKSMRKLIKGYSPLPDNIHVGKSEIHGMGLIASKKIKPKINLGVTHVKDKRFQDGLMRTPLGGFLNHSSRPNCKYSEEREMLSLITTRIIDEGEEITVDYTPYYFPEIVAKYK